MTRPLLLLDIDGVLNPYASAEPPVGFIDHHLFVGEEPVRVNPVHGSWITEAAKVLDVTWASSWNEEANELLAPLLHIAPLPLVPMPRGPFDPNEKVPRIADYAQQRPLAWVDDLHNSYTFGWATERVAPTLLIPIDPAIGLTRECVDQVIAWAAAL